MSQALLDNNTQIELLKNNKELENTNDLIIEEQKSFLETNLGKVINTGVNIGLKAILPDFLEDQIINVKDTLMSEGLKDGIKTIVEDVTDFGKGVVGIFTGKLENVEQLSSVVKNPEIIETTSDLLGVAIDYAKQKKLMDSSTATMLKKGKNVILDSVSNQLEDMVNSQLKSIDNLEKYINKWEKAYEAKNIETMKTQFEKINKELNKILPLENTIKEARQIENIHNLIVSNGNNFNLSTDELELARKLV